MSVMERDIKKAAETNFDLIITGGGVYGIMLALESARRGLNFLLLERDDFYGATSLNHLRTVHGGLRYLQSADLLRFKESVHERRWFFRHMPGYVNLMPCLLPLYGKGLQRNSILKAGILANDLLSFNRNSGVRSGKKIPCGKVVSKDNACSIFPKADRDGLTGGAIWYDGSLPEHQRIFVELLKASVKKSGTALNYMEVKQLTKDNNKVTGVECTDKETGKTIMFKAPVVINAAGPWCRELASAFHKDEKKLFVKNLLYWNVLFKKEALSDYALGLSASKGAGHTYFFHPWKNRLVVGCGELVVDKIPNNFKVPDDEMDKFISDINKIAPHLKLTKDDIERVYVGVLPAKDSGCLANREVIMNHQEDGGPAGLYSVSGVKFTTSRLVSHKLMNRIYPDITAGNYEDVIKPDNFLDLALPYAYSPNSELIKKLKEVVKTESVIHLSDLIIRRTSLGDNPGLSLKILPELRDLFSFSDSEWEKEIVMLKNELNRGLEEIK